METDLEFQYQLADFIVRKSEMYTSVSVWEDGNGEWVAKYNYNSHKLPGYKFLYSHTFQDVVRFDEVLRQIKLNLEEDF